LHMGHALNSTLQDTLIRWKRLQGYNTLWQPGTDHAGIATQSVVAKALDDAGEPGREELGREKFLEKVWQHKEKYGSNIINQLRKLGSSCDWSRERFTMDDGLCQAVNENFVKLYNAGLIYRGTRMVNWSPALQTALSNDEVEPVELTGHMWKFRYELSDGSGSIEIETTRPETYFGDSAVAVHPDDPRYKDMIGKTVRLPIIGREIPIVADDYANPEKGTGAVKITPAHDPNDYELGKRHDLEQITVMNLDGTMNERCAHFAGQDRFECRKNLLTEFHHSGVLLGKTKIKHAVGHCYRSHVPVEPMVTEQWFVNMKPLAERALKETQEGRVDFHPARWTKVYSKWLDEVQDWCISRQIWWGHRLPVWYDQDSGEVIVSSEDPTKDPANAGRNLVQDNDVLDTWFSSALWPFSTLGWPDQEEQAFKDYFPTNVLVTDRGIIYFWVARMVMMSLFNLDKAPFKDVYIHGTVLDETGAKMSKSWGNGIDPLVMIEGGSMEYCPGGLKSEKDRKKIKKFACDGFGADAVRYTLLEMCTEGQDLKLSPERFEGGRNFVNKVFNAGRFLLMNLSDRPLEKIPSIDELQALNLGFEEQWLLDRLQRSIRSSHDALGRFRFSEYATSAYHFFRDDLCDWYLEWAKHQFLIGGEAADIASKVLAHALDQSLRLLHPGMPYITEYLWQQLRGVSNSAAWTDDLYLMTQDWPEAQENLIDDQRCAQMDELQALVSGMRNVRTKQGMPDKTKITVIMQAANAAQAIELSKHSAFLCDRANLESLSIDAVAEKPEASITEVIGDIVIHVPLKGLVDLDAFREKLEKQLESKEKVAAGKRGRLSNEKYVNGAPADKVQETRDMLAQDEAEIEKIKASLAELD
ncbi:MAG: valine--tRNA ligase, partial [Planctomycetes bacterium]|nr:valine--tRNA ligase [Planctomycetota bacterium]